MVCLGPQLKLVAKIMIMAKVYAHGQWNKKIFLETVLIVRLLQNNPFQVIALWVYKGPSVAGNGNGFFT